MARTLGEPDYIEINTEARAIDAKSMKLFADMAGDVCRKAVFHDRDEPDPKRRVLMRYDDVDQNIAWLMLKFWQVKVDATDQYAMRRLRAVYGAMARQTSIVLKAWEAVCVAALLAPEFTTY